MSCGFLQLSQVRLVHEPVPRTRKPKWHRMARAVACSFVEQFCDVSAADVNKGTQALVCRDAVSSATDFDVNECLKSLLVAMGLGDDDTGLILLAMNHQIKSNKVFIGADTWRPVLVTALLVAVQRYCPEQHRETAKTNIRRACAHWWSEDRIDSAVNAFISYGDRRKVKSRKAVREHCQGILGRSRPVPDHTHDVSMMVGVSGTMQEEEICSI